MTTVTIRGISVKFPFAPYDIQNDYMSKVIECLETQQNGILESPTGTGKTLCLLCASLAWLENRKKQYQEQQKLFLPEVFDESFEDQAATPVLITVPKIIYTSRTHTQLQQAMQEMKRTAYNYMKACILGSREQMCIDAEVMDERNAALKVNICRTKVKRGQCCYFKNVEKKHEHPALCNLNIVDIEDIVNLGKTHNFCPYYMARELKTKADVVFMPYNYLLDPRTRKAMEVDFQNDIIIFDEAHNIEKICEDSLSVQIKTSDIKAAVDDVEAVLHLIITKQRLDVEEINFVPNQLITLKQMLIAFEENIKEIRLVQLALEGTVYDGDFIFEILDKSGIRHNNYFGVSGLIEDVMEFLASTKLIKGNSYNLQTISNLLFIVFYKSEPEFRQKIKECFKVQIDEEITEKYQSGRFTQFSQTQREKCRVLNFWCFCPGFGMNMLMDRNIHCVILTSGTLAPLKPLISELELDAGVRIENPHIVKGDQVCVKILSNGPDKEPLISNFHNRNNPKYINSLGMVISNLIRVIPDGVLIFFPSYAIMQKSIDYWQGNGIWEAINRIKPICVEPKDKISFNNAMVDYYSNIQNPNFKGAIFMGVCRGKVSEGLDFADINGRAVLITGLPYPPLKEPKVILKKQYLDFRHGKDKDYLKGEEWYSLEATRAINQAIGRVIRHKNDYGAIILLDARFSVPKVKNNMSLWLRRHITDTKNFGEIIRNVRIFFQQAQEKIQTELEEFSVEQLESMEACLSDKLMEVDQRKLEDLEDSPSKKRR